MVRKIDRRVILRSYILGRQDLTLDKIVDQLSKEFEEDKIPDRSTISRYLKRYKSELPEELKEDAPFVWSKMKNVPWEGSATVMEAFSHYVSSGFPDSSGPFTDRHAKWVWRVSQALGTQSNLCLFDTLKIETGLDIENIWHKGVRTTEEISMLYGVPSRPTRTDILAIATEYSLREIRGALFQERKNTNDLDFWLAFSPWNGPDQLSRYCRARDEFGGFKRILWHVQYLRWMNYVNLEPSGDESSSAASPYDGLLPSQARIISLWLETAENNPNLWETELDQWYLEFHRRLQLERRKCDVNASFDGYDSLVAQIMEELDERQHQTAEQE